MWQDSAETVTAVEDLSIAKAPLEFTVEQY